MALDLTVWAFGRNGMAYVWQLGGGPKEITRRIISNDGTVAPEKTRRATRLCMALPALVLGQSNLMAQLSYHPLGFWRTRPDHRLWQRRDYAARGLRRR